jgi:hypothetical protein
MSEIKNVKEWNNELEVYLKQLGEYSQIYSILHKTSEKKYNKISYKMDIPNIIISTVAGTLSISSTGLFQGMEKQASIFIGILSLTSSILTTINSYFGFKKRSENHRLVSIQYQKIYLKIDLILGLKNEERPPINDFIKFTVDEYNRLAEISPIIDKEILEEFKTKFKEYKTKVYFPQELNGLSPITLYSEEETTNSKEIVIKSKSSDFDETTKSKDLVIKSKQSFDETKCEDNV